MFGSQPGIYLPKASKLPTSRDTTLHDLIGNPQPERTHMHAAYYGLDTLSNQDHDNVKFPSRFMCYWPVPVADAYPMDVTHTPIA